MSIRREVADDQGVALAAPTAKGRRTGFEATPLELVSKREHESRSAGPDRMPKCDSTTVDVDAVLMELEHAGRVESDCGECLVDLDQVEV